MSKMTRALKKASEQRSGAISPSEENARVFVKTTRESKMRRTWFTWVIVTTVIVAVFYAFNYHGGKDAVPLSEIFPDEGGIEYEFVQDDVVEKVAKKTTVPVQKIKEEIVKKVEIPIASVSEITKNNNFNYTVQIASFKDQKKAQEALTKVRAKIPSAYIGSQDLGAKGVWHRIYAGQFELRSEAEVTLSDIKKSYDSSFIISPKKAK